MANERPPRRMLVAHVLLAALGVLAVWRWWLGPRDVAAAEREAPKLVELRRATIATLAEFEIELELGEQAAAAELLTWQAPGECVEVYRVRVDEHHRDASVAVFVGHEEEHATYYLALAGSRARAGAGDREVAPVIGVLTIEGHEPRVRELWWGTQEVGPSAPDFACRRRGWDPFEDALALGWPRLPRARTWVGSRWRGAVVEGRCHETICLDPDGTFGHSIPCRARPWTEQLVGVDGTLALILGEWDDRHDFARIELGIFTSREVVLDEGRPLYVRAVIEQRWAGVRRELSLVRLDDCGSRSLITPSDQIHVDEARAQLGAAIHARI